MKYRKKPVVVEAIKWDGSNRQDIVDFCDDKILGYIDHGLPFRIATLEGEHIASVGDYIIRGVQDEVYPCKPDIFELTYEEVK